MTKEQQEAIPDLKRNEVYIVRVKGKKGVLGEKSITTTTKLALKLMTEKQQARDAIVARKKRGDSHYPVDLDDLRVFYSKAELFDFFDDAFIGTEEELAQSHDQLKTELSAKDIELEELKAKLAMLEKGEDPELKPSAPISVANITDLVEEEAENNDTAEEQPKQETKKRGRKPVKKD